MKTLNCLLNCPSKVDSLFSFLINVLEYYVKLSGTNKGKRGIAPLNTYHIRKCDILFGTETKRKWCHIK